MSRTEGEIALALVAMSAGQLVKWSTTPNHLELLASSSGDTAVNCVGVVLRDCDEGAPCEWIPMLGAHVPMYSDGTATVAAGDILSPSATIDGAVMSDPGDRIGLARDDAPADVGALIDAYFEPPASGSSPAPDIVTDDTLTGDGTAETPLGVNLDEENVWTANQHILGIDLGAISAAAINMDARATSAFEAQATGACTLANPTNPQLGDVLTCGVTNASGTATLAFGNLITFPGSVVPVLSLGAGARDVYTLRWNGATWECLASQAFGV